MTGGALICVRDRLQELRPRDKLKDLVLPLCLERECKLIDLSSFICFLSRGLRAAEAGGWRYEKLLFRYDKFCFLICYASAVA
ncbi:MAG: hypothetical protein EZS28_050606 [Streblomastix strix]|uniref:Uncharacterized protein n=1 Tax=Streblomastix strix TaxID=222440 RepID=A0A5J4T6R1_9EUKA|nr:MAG: hypothetical protein EZS28_050606 [Streblomastix strix]